jgi:PHD/YefM family antitoxin component YafN of YafNO toxin-antitoxin module
LLNPYNNFYYFIIKKRINYDQKIKIADAQTDLPSLVKSVTEDNKIYAIENQEDSVILISQKNYESLQETIELLSIPDLRESLQLSLQQINENETYSLEEVLGDID